MSNHPLSEILRGVSDMVISIQGTSVTVSQRWLRSICICSECGDSTAGLRWLSPAESPRHPEALSTNETAGALDVRWSDGHRSTFDSQWLLAATTSSEGTVEPTLATSKIDWCRYEDCLESDETLLDALHAVNTAGVVGFRGAPADPSDTVALARRFGPVRTTSYGEVQDFTTKPNPKTAAETSREQQPHTDEPFRYYPPGFLFFHSIAAAPVGQGSTTLVDGFDAAEQLRLADPASFTRLATNTVTFHRRHGTEVHFETTSTVFTLDDGDRLAAVRFNPRCLAPLDLRANDVDGMLESLGAFAAIVESPANQLTIHLEPGDVLAFDNHRMMHGRTAFDAKAVRHLRSCNVDRDAVHSTYRVLAQRFAATQPRIRLAQGPTT